MAITGAMLASLFNGCDLNAQYEAGSLPTIGEAKLLRLASYLTKLDPDTFGTVAANVTPDQVVVFIYRWLRDQIVAIEKSDARQAVLDAVADPDEF